MFFLLTDMYAVCTIYIQYIQVISVWWVYCISFSFMPGNYDAHQNLCILWLIMGTGKPSATVTHEARISGKFAYWTTLSQISLDKKVFTTSTFWYYLLHFWYSYYFCCILFYLLEKISEVSQFPVLLPFGDSLILACILCSVLRQVTRVTSLDGWA